jgi:hypothetical protein
MKNPSFPEGVVLALAAGLIASVAYTVLPGVLGLEWTTRALIAGLGLGYVLYLLHRSSEHTGRIVTLTAWLLVAGVAWVLVMDPLLYLALHLVLVWLVRVLYHQPGPLAALLDMALNLFALMAGLWAFWHADSVFMGVWTFFLVQAMFVGIPSVSNRNHRRNAAPEQQSDRFRLACHSAEAALRKLTIHH